MTDKPRPSQVYSYDKETVLKYMRNIKHRIIAFRPPRTGETYMALGGAILKQGPGEFATVAPGEWRLIVKPMEVPV